MGTFEITVCTTLCILFLSALTVSLNKKYDTLKCKWIAEGRESGLRKAKWNVEKVFPLLVPLVWEKTSPDYYKCIFLDAYEARIVRLHEDNRYMVLIKKYNNILLVETNYFFTLDSAMDYVNSFRIGLLDSITNETI